MVEYVYFHQCWPFVFDVGCRCSVFSCHWSKITARVATTPRGFRANMLQLITLITAWIFQIGCFFKSSALNPPIPLLNLKIQRCLDTFTLKYSCTQTVQNMCLAANKGIRELSLKTSSHNKSYIHTIQVQTLCNVLWIL